MRVFVTGGTGFVGRHVCAIAVSRGHEVVSLSRSTSNTAWATGLEGPGSIRFVEGDLGGKNDLGESMIGSDLLIHLAAVKGGDFYSRFAGTVLGTERVLNAARESGTKKLVAISTFSVYDYDFAKAGSVFDETVPVVTDMAGRDEYTETKSYQDELYQQFGAEEANRMVMIRPGMIYGAGELWHPLLGGDLGPVYLRIGGSARSPITYVENVAEAIVMSAERLESGTAPLVDGEVINIVDDDLPTQNEYAKAVSSALEQAGRPVPPKGPQIPFGLMKAGSKAIALVDRRMLAGRLKLPGIAVANQLDARFKDFAFANSKAKRLLSWEPRFGLVESIERSIEAEKRSENSNDG